MGFESKCSILNGQEIYIKKSKLNIADMWLIPLDRVTYMYESPLNFQCRHPYKSKTKLAYPLEQAHDLQSL